MPETTITPDIASASLFLRSAAERALVLIDCPDSMFRDYHQDRMIAAFRGAARALGYRLVPLDKEETNDDAR